MTEPRDIIANASGQAKAELTVLYNRQLANLKKYQDTGKRSDRADYEDAKQALEQALADEVARQKPAGNFPSIPAAHAWLTEQGYHLTEKTLRNHVQQGKLPTEKHRNGKVKLIRLLDLERYARQWLDQPAGQVSDDYRARLIKAQAEKTELDNDIKRGRYLDREKEEQRDAAVLASLRRHIESAAADRVQQFVADVVKHVSAETRAVIVAKQPAWVQQDLDYLARMFDGFLGATENDDAA